MQEHQMIFKDRNQSLGKLKQNDQVSGQPDLHSES